MTSSLYPHIPLAHAGAVLSIDLGAVADNYRELCRRLGGVACSAVVKSDAYGLGVDQVGPVLADAGCNVFFVAHIEEGIRLRGILPNAEIAEIHVLNGLFPGVEDTYKGFDLIPVLGSLTEAANWKSWCAL